MANELQTAFQVSQQERKPDDSAKIQALVAAGRFVVVCEGTEYCPRTDAILGSCKLYLGDYVTREEANQSCGEVYYGAGDLDFYVLPRFDEHWSKYEHEYFQGIDSISPF